MRRLKCIPGIMLLNATMCFGQTVKVEQLLGSWKSAENPKIVFSFNEDGKAEYNAGRDIMRVDFEVRKDGEILVGTTLYKIVDFTDRKMTLQNVGIYPNEFDRETYTSEYDTIVEYYPDGTKKREGVLHNGRQHGKWITWMRNGMGESSISKFNEGRLVWTEDFFYTDGEQGSVGKQYPQMGGVLHLTRKN